jgi:predicted ATP-binding protein involved in virulence
MRSKMKVKLIKISKLFGIFDHEIPLNTIDRITIIHGPNGFGKTALLKIVNSFFSAKYSVLFSTPFSYFSIAFDDESTVKVEQKKEKKEKSGKILTITYLKDKQDLNLNEYLSKSNLSMIDRVIPELDRVGPETWFNMRTGAQLSFQDVLERYPDRLPEGLSFREDPWLKSLRTTVHVSFIETQRLLNVDPVQVDKYRYGMPQGMSLSLAVEKQSENLKEIIKVQLAEYGTLSQSLDRTFPSRLVEAEASSKTVASDLSTLRTQLNELEDKRSNLKQVGLLDKDENPDFQVPEEIDDATRDVLLKVLSVYIKDVQKKLSVFDDIAEKISVLTRIINDRFLYKKLAIDKEKGFIFTMNITDETLPPTALSSGEQHELVLLYELLFNVKPNSLILIDEPELSLHVAWQFEFLKDLSLISRLSNFDTIIATHSPQIIGDRSDLLVRLKGPNTK